MLPAELLFSVLKTMLLSGFIDPRFYINSITALMVFLADVEAKDDSQTEIRCEVPSSVIFNQHDNYLVKRKTHTQSLIHENAYSSFQG